MRLFKKPDKLALRLTRRPLRGNPKNPRPVALNQMMHVVLKSRLAVREKSFLLRAREIDRLLKSQAQIFGIKLHATADAGNHLHLALATPSRRALRGLFKATCGLIARKTLGVKRGPPTGRRTRFKEGAHRSAGDKSPERAPRESFFDGRPFTRVLSGRRDVAGLKNYLMVNRLETLGFERLAARAMIGRIAEFRRSTELVSLGFN